MDVNTQATVSTVEQMAGELDRDPEKWREFVEHIRQMQFGLGDMRHRSMDHYSKVLVIKTFQRVAYMDPDTGPIRDIADWCLYTAVALLERCPEDVELLTLVGKNWLNRAQPSLARIHQTERSSSSSGSSIAVALSTSEEEREAELRREEERLETSDYVEARGMLYAAGEKYKTAVNIARRQGSLTGELLTTAAEAFMSLGNVTSLRENREHYHGALEALRSANEIPGYTLPSYLQQYLDEYGPLDEATYHNPHE